MTALDLDLARALVALPGWRWMSGMLAQPGDCRVLVVEDDGAYVLAMPQGWASPTLLDASHLPDYRDPATAGCLAELLGSDDWAATAFGDRFGASAAPMPSWAYGRSLGEAIARALVALGRCPGGTP